MFAVSPTESQQQQKDMLLEAMVEDIASQITLQLPVIRLTPEKQTPSDQRQVIASTAGGAAVAGTGDLIFAVLRYVTNVVMTNIVSGSAYGTYAAIYTSAAIVGIVAALGLDSTMLRFLSIYHAKNEHGLAAGLVRFVVWMTLTSGLLCGILFYFSATAIAHLAYHKDAYALPLKEIALLVPLISLQLVFANGLQALKAIKRKVFVDRLIQPVLCLVFIGVFYRLGLRLEALILATICGYLASVITGHVFLRKASRQLVRDVSPRFEPKIWLRFALPMSFYALIQNILNSTDVLFLTAFATTTQVGLYAAADRASTFVVMPLFALNTIFLPLITEYYLRGEFEQLTSLSRVVTKWSFSLSLPIFLCFCIFHEAILSIFSKSYTAAAAVLIILSFGNLVNAVAGFAGGLLLMTGHSRVILANSGLTILVNIGLAFLLVSRFNVIGAAVAAALALVILDVAYIIETYRILKTHTFRWDMLKSVVAGGAASMVGLLLLRVIHVGYGYRAIIGALGLVIPFMLVYVLVLALLRFSKEDMMVFDAVQAKIGWKKHI
jgi:O-antigen/teichoic acid export membrane protein